MFRKIHSKRDPRDTLVSEFKKEFGVYFAKAGDWFQNFTRDYSRAIYGCMVGMLAVSVVVSFTVFRSENPPKQPLVNTKPDQATAAGFDQIIRTGGALKKTLELKAEIQSIISRDSLTGSDSIRLGKALDQLQQTNKSLEK